MTGRVDWLLFILLGFFWGSSYIFIKIGVEAGLTPFTLVSLRLLFGMALLGIVVPVAREPLPRRLRQYGHLAVLGAFSVAIPFVLITWAERSVDSVSWTTRVCASNGVPGSLKPMWPLRPSPRNVRSSPPLSRISRS